MARSLADQIAARTAQTMANADKVIAAAEKKNPGVYQKDKISEQALYLSKQGAKWEAANKAAANKAKKAVKPVVKPRARK